MSDEAELIAAHAGRVLPLATARLGDEYFYQSLPLCVIDAVYSIGVRYSGVQRVVARYCERLGWRTFRAERRTLPPTHDQESIAAFCERTEEIGPAAMADAVFGNRQRTSSRAGVLKAEAAYRFAAALRVHGVNYFQDLLPQLMTPGWRPTSGASLDRAAAFHSGTSSCWPARTSSSSRIG